MVHGAHFRRQRYLRGVFALSRRRTYKLGEKPGELVRVT